jgi:hypothetical protein
MKLVHKQFAQQPGFWFSNAIGLVLTAANAGSASAGPPLNPACARNRCIDGRPVDVHANSTARHAVTEPSPSEQTLVVRYRNLEIREGTR